MPRVIVFGLDAAAPGLIQRWRADLPTLSRLMSGGVSGILASTIPPFTSPAWTCMVTGKNPAKTGIFGLRQRQEGSYNFAPPTSGTRRTPALWDLLGQAGKRAIVVNVPDTYPPIAIEGVMISGRPAPVHPGAAITYPPDLRTRLEHAAGPYLVGPSADFDDASQSDELPAWEAVMDSQQKALEYLLDNESWDLLFYVSMAVDGTGHHFWKYLDPAHPDYDPVAAETLGDTMRTIYQLEDQRIARILERMRPDDLLLIVSDHGSAACYRHIAVNLWLIEKGYLVLKEDAAPAGRGWMQPFVQSIVGAYRRSELVRRVARPFKRTALRDAVVSAHFVQKTGGRIPVDALPIDWSRTRAYYLGDERLYLNVMGREPQGIVGPGVEYQSLRSELRAALLAAEDAESGRRLFAHVYFGDELYAGPYLDQAPDLILEPGDVHWSLGGAVGQTIVDRPVVSGKHHPDGVFLAWGADVRADVTTAASIYDITPTILHALGLPVPEDCDGSVQLDWFEPDSATARRPVATAAAQDFQGEDYELTDQEAAQLEATLRNLGYLD